MCVEGGVWRWRVVCWRMGGKEGRAKNGFGKARPSRARHEVVWRAREGVPVLCSCARHGKLAYRTTLTSRSNFFFGLSERHDTHLFQKQVECLQGGIRT